MRNRWALDLEQEMRVSRCATMEDRMIDESERTGSDLQQSQSGDESGMFAGHRNHQQDGRQMGSADDQSRGERFDEQQGGGRGDDGFEQQQQDGLDGDIEFEQDQQDHQDRGQSSTEFESDQS